MIESIIILLTVDVELFSILLHPNSCHTFCMRMCVLVSMIFSPKISFGINITKKKTYRLEYSLRLSSRSVSWQKAKKKKGSLRWRLDGQAPCENRWKKCLATQKVVVVAHWIFPLPVAYSTHIVWYGLAVWEEELDKKKMEIPSCMHPCLCNRGGRRASRRFRSPLLTSFNNCWQCVRLLLLPGKL